MRGQQHQAKRGRAPHPRSAITVYPTAIVASKDRKGTALCDAFFGYARINNADGIEAEQKPSADERELYKNTVSEETTVE